MIKWLRRNISNKKFTKRNFVDLHDRNSARLFQNLHIQNCQFESCTLSLTKDPGRRSSVHNVHIEDCEATGCIIYAAILQDVHVEGLQIHGLLQIWGAVFQRVTISGKVGGIMISPLLDPKRRNSEMQKRFEKASSDFYSDVDWALDISKAEFTAEIDIRGIPARLIRRDLETQAVVTREKAIEGNWRQLDLSGTNWPTAIEFLLKRDDPDVVLVAPKRHRSFGRLLQGIEQLRGAGIAEP
jgi:hypothetical protein